MGRGGREPRIYTNDIYLGRPLTGVRVDNASPQQDQRD